MSFTRINQQFSDFEETYKTFIAAAKKKKEAENRVGEINQLMKSAVEKAKTASKPDLDQIQGELNKAQNSELDSLSTKYNEAVAVLTAQKTSAMQKMLPGLKELQKVITDAKDISAEEQKQLSQRFQDLVQLIQNSTREANLSELIALVRKYLPSTLALISNRPAVFTQNSIQHTFISSSKPASQPGASTPANTTQTPRVKA